VTATPTGSCNVVRSIMAHLMRVAADEMHASASRLIAGQYATLVLAIADCPEPALKPMRRRFLANAKAGRAMARLKAARGDAAWD